MSSLTIRNASLGKSIPNPDLSREMTIEIYLDARVPFISMSQSVGTGVVTADISDVTLVEYNKSFDSKLLPNLTATKAKNILVDPLNLARFTTVAIIGSLLTQDESILVHDAKYGDMILIPSLAFLGDSPVTENLMSGMSYRIEGYQVGGGVKEVTTSLYQKVQENLNIPRPATTLQTKTHLMTIAGFKEVGGHANNSGSTHGTKYLESDLLSALQLASIGSSTALGGDVSSARMVKVSNSTYALAPLKPAPLDDILIVAQL